MPDSSNQPIRGGADLDALRAKLAALNKEAAGVLDRLSAEADTLTSRLEAANKQLEVEATAEQQVTTARAKRPPPQEAAAAKGQEATNTERLAQAEERAARAAQLRAEAEAAAAKSAQEAALAVERAARAPLALGPGARFTAGAGGTSDILGQEALARAAERQRLVDELFQRQQLALPAASQIQLGPTGPNVATKYNQYGGIGTPPPPAAAGHFAQTMAASTQAERDAAAATAQHSDAAAKAAEGQGHYTEAIVSGNAQLRTFDREIETTALRLGQVSNQFERNGYLTSDFIAAAAKGQVTIRELGTQVGGTIAKFAGWTAAASAVYGAARAVEALGKGALDSESGVNELNRVVTVELPGGADAVKQKFRDLSHSFNLPISDVTDAAYGMAKAFHGDLPQALEATKDALFAVKVGELSAADATRYLTAIINGFRLQPQQLHDVFDALNQVQNRFGGSLQNVAAGVAKAAGAFKAAGGDYLTLIKLIEAGVKVTGASGENVGTAFSRSAGRVLTEAGRKAIADVGLNPDLNYPELFGQALAKSKGASPQTVQAIARALIPSGGQFARILVPILQNPQLLGSIDQALEKRAGSAARERTRLLQSPQEQLKRLSTDAQQLGSALGDAGALTPLLALVGALTKGVEETTKLVELVEHLAGPLDKALVPLLEIVAAIKLARRFDIGSSFAAGVPGKNLLTRPAGDVFNAGIVSSTAAVQKELTASYAQALSTQKRAQIRANAAAVEAQLYTDEALAATSGAEQEEFARRANAARNANLRYAEAQDTALVEANLIQAELTAREEQLNVYRKNLATGMSREEAAVAAGYVQVNPIGTTKAAGNPEPIIVGGAGAGATQEAQAAKLSQATAVAETTATVNALQSIANAGEDAAQTASDQLSSLETDSIGGAAESAKAASEALKAKEGMAAMGGRLLAMVGEIGLIAYVAYEFAIKPIIDATRQYEQQAAQAERDARSLKGGVENAAKNVVKANQGPGLLGSIGEFVKHPLGGGPTTDFQAIADQLKVVDQVRQAQGGGRLLDISQIRGSLAERLSQTQDQGTKLVILRDGLDELQNSYIAQIEKVAGPKYKQGKGAKQSLKNAEAAIREQLAAANRAFNTSTNQIDQLDLTGLGTFSDQTTARLQLQGPTSANLSRLRGTLRAIVNQSQAGADPAAILKLVDAINQQANNLADRYGKAAGPNDTLGQAQGRAHGIEIVRRALNRGQLERQLKNAQDERAAALQELAKEEEAINGATASVSARGLGQRGEVRTSGLQALYTQAQTLKDRAAKAGSQATAISQLITLVFGALKQADDAAGVAAAEAQRYDAQTSYLVAQAGGGLAGDRVQLGRDTGGPYKDLKKGTTEWYQHQADILNTQNSISQQEQQQAADAKQKAQQAAQNAKQAAEQARQAAQAFISAQADYAASLTADPVRQARIRYQEAQRLVRYASGRTEQLEAQADVNNRRRDLSNATIQSRLNDIEFNASIGKLSHDAEIAQLEALRKRIKGNKDLRRQITQEIYNLKHDAATSTGDLELNLSDFKLPTAYEIRRAVLGASRGTNVTQSYDTTINVSRDVDLDKLGAHVDRIHHGTNKALQRAAGMR